MIIGEDLATGAVFVDHLLSAATGSVDVDAIQTFPNGVRIHVDNVVLVRVSEYFYGLDLHQCLVLAPVLSNGPRAGMLGRAENGGSLYVHGMMEPIQARIGRNGEAFFLPESILLVADDDGVIVLVGFSVVSSHAYDVQVPIPILEDCVVERGEMIEYLWSWVDHCGRN